jgi:hypothetical protein
MDVWRAPQGVEAQRIEKILLLPAIPKKKALRTKTTVTGTPIAEIRKRK